ncbi:hypothetical protein [Cyclobacterium xiamenense]|uniref:hypothetical protein n=1 Tax=Cyclobacterium xiamenense TaxID=1297121 RepID=UPI0012B891E3|nr:hypothetical protein [Cyclobacterium xiamenense]
MNYLEKDVLVVATMEMAKRKKGSYFPPSDVVQWIYPNDWHCFMEEEMEALLWLYQNDFLEVLAAGQPLNPNFSPPEPVTIRLKQEAI